jgi:hypothetical protein
LERTSPLGDVRVSVGVPTSFSKGHTRAAFSTSVRYFAGIVVFWFVPSGQGWIPRSVPIAIATGFRTAISSCVWDLAHVHNIDGIIAIFFVV